MKKILLFIPILIFSIGCNSKKSINLEQFAADQLEIMVECADKNRATEADAIFPRSINSDGSMRFVAKSDWCSGFFAGTLWLMYEYTQDSYWLEKAKVYTELLEDVATQSDTHDLGFMLYSSYGKGYMSQPNEAYCATLITAAKSLAERYNPSVGAIKSWDFGSWNFPVIIDNMMNLDLLFFASKNSGDPLYQEIAIAHADKTLDNHFRADFSSYHVISYNDDGGVESKGTHQGCDDESVWSRGQAWGLYGYTMCYRFTKDERYLHQATAIANYFFSLPNLPSDLVPYWDMSDVDIPSSPRDVSAAAVIASGLYELSLYVNKEQRCLYRSYADKIIESISSSYLCKEGGSHGFILDHSTGNYPENDEIDTSIIYAEYYFLEALIRQRNVRN